MASDLHLAALYEEWAAREPDPETRSRRLRGFNSEPEHILEPLAHVRSVGGIEAYLRDAGVTAEEIRAVQRRTRSDRS